MLRCILQMIKKNRDKSSNIENEKGERKMANFTVKESNLLFQTIIEKDLGINLSDNMADLRSKTKVFNDFSKKAVIEQVDNKQDTTRVRIFRCEYIDPETGCPRVAYMPTI